MDFTFKQNLNKDLILSNISEEQIMEFYLKVPVKKGLFCSSLREDNRPTCSFYRNKGGYLIFKDFATGQHLNCFGVVETLFGVNYYKALEIIANDFGIQHSDIPKNKGTVNKYAKRLSEKTISKIQVEIKEYSKEELEWWNKFGITKEILEKFNVFSCKYVFLEGNIIAESTPQCPIYGYYGGKIKKDGEKIELWKCYFPFRKQYRFLGNYPSKKLQCYDKLPRKGKICVITKSQKDCLALYSYGIPACAPNSEVIIPSETIINDLLSRFEHVFALWDNDITGVSFINKIKKKYPQLHCLIIPRKLKAKDFSDLRALYGNKKTREFIIEYLKNYKND